MRQLFLFIVFVFSASLLRSQQITDILIEPDTANQSVTYGTRVGFTFFTVNKKGKKKEVEFSKIDKLITAECLTPGCTFTGGGVVMPASSGNKGLISASVRFTTLKPELKLDKTFEIKMNFKAAAYINFKGETGAAGLPGEDAGIPVLFRDGKTGGDGGKGGNGITGPDITVRVRKEYDDVFKKETWFFYVKRDSIGDEKVYRCVYPQMGIHIIAAGGDGGNGGKGGSGGRGKHGDAAKNKEPGNGGDGGNGGVGGDGGNGGNITVIAHTNSRDIVDYLRINNSGGTGGAGGPGGNGGEAGNADTGQTAASAGKPGRGGNMGQPGMQGPLYKLIVEDF